MRQNSIKWTTQEVADLFSTEVKRSPNNLLIAFTRIGRRLNTNTNNVSRAWYRVYRNKTEAFTINSSDVNMKNVKNTRTPKEALLEAPIHEAIVSTQNFDGMVVVTIKKYYLA